MTVSGKKVVDVPEYLDENERMHFMYLRACYILKEKPVGYFEGDAKICAEVIESGGDIIQMYHEGCDPLYAALLSNPYIDEVILRKTIERHIPF
jgi:hypothetical protein